MESSTIFVGNLVFDAAEEDLRALFSDYGTVASIKLRRKKGFALWKWLIRRKLRRSSAN